MEDPYRRIITFSSKLAHVLYQCRWQRTYEHVSSKLFLRYLRHNSIKIYECRYLGCYVRTPIKHIFSN